MGDTAANLALVPSAAYTVEWLLDELIDLEEGESRRRRLMDEAGPRDLQSANANENAFKNKTGTSSRLRTTNNRRGNNYDGVAAEERGKSDAAECLTFTEADFEARKDEIRGWLTLDEYREFWQEFINLKYELGLEGDHWNCDGVWEELLTEALCYVDITYPECQPENQRAWAELLAALYDADIYALYGDPTFQTRVEAYCTATTVDSVVTKACTWLRAVPDVVSGDDSESNKIPLRVLDQLVQSAFAGEACEWNADWATNGWYTPCVPSDLSTISDPVNVWLTMGDTAIDTDMVRMNLKDKVCKTVTWNKEWSHDSFAGNNDSYYVEEMCAVLKAHQMM